MSAAVLAAPGRIEVRRIPAPVPGPGQVRVRLSGCGVCASNIPPWEGREWFDYPFAPGAPGHEGWGVVDALGEGVQLLRVGEPVAMLSGHAYAQYDVASQSAVVSLPADLAADVFPGEPLGCAINVMTRSSIAAGQTVAVVGVGFLGALVTRLASLAGAKVIAVSRRPFSMQIARRMGCKHCLQMDEPQTVVDAVKALTAEAMCDIVIEAVGNQRALDLASELTAVRGRLVVAGYHQDGPRQVNMQLWNWRGLDVVNAHERDEALYVRGMAAAVELACAGVLPVGSLVTHQFPLAELGEALSQTCRRPEGFLKAAVRMPGGAA
jgi:threonine dehydrogenase-like Zn-dependent dehydrogenase